ncbi:hypothetical protein MNBD_CHLOROFLEXI01-4986 [hydrothermal vent metagenome]|uniref:Uncharacterized protein n=1 Tax=hydrothermal vent metagenome TaxID=652676 RepID=A0A3B0UZD9_9ZZZZ
MKPLVYYCRWQGANLRLRGRDETAVWGHLVYKANSEQEFMQPFRFDLGSWQLTLQEEDGEKIVQLDEMGTVSSKAG